MAPKHHPTPLSGGDRKALAKELGKARAMTNKGTRGRTVTLKVKFADFELISRSRTLTGVVGSRNEFEIVSAELLKALFPMQKAVRLLGVSMSGFKLDEIRGAEQISLTFENRMAV
jgi:DNA polymerase-4